MASVEERLNDGTRGEIVYATVGGPGYSTKIGRTAAGYEKRASEWAHPLGAWEWGERVVSESELAALLAFFHARRGRAVGFRFKDFADYKVSLTEGVVEQVAPGVFQLMKEYGGAGGSRRLIAKPVASTVSVRVGGSPAAFTLDAARGRIAVAGAEAAAIKWSGEFDCLVRFGEDQLKHQFKVIDKATGRALFQLYSLPLVEYLESEA